MMVFSGVVFIPQTLFGQYQKWSLSASAGLNRLNLSAVDNKNASDVAGWVNQGIPVGDFASVKTSPFYSAGVRYRSDREFALSLSGTYWNKTVSSSYDGPDASLHLDRGVGSTDIMFGVNYYPTAQPLQFEWYLQGNVDLTMARATAKAVGSVSQKPGGTLMLVPFIDTDGKYKKIQSQCRSRRGRRYATNRKVLPHGKCRLPVRAARHHGGRHQPVRGAYD